MYVFIMDHEAGQITKAKVPDELEHEYDNDAGHDRLVEAINSQYDSQTCDYMITDFDDVLEGAIKVPDCDNPFCNAGMH